MVVKNQRETNSSQRFPFIPSCFGPGRHLLVPQGSSPTLDLPPIIVPPAGGGAANPTPPGTLPLPVNQRLRFQQQQQQQRPSLSYLIFLSILFFFLSNRDDSKPTGEEESTSLRSALGQREARRDGLAHWLGVNTTFQTNDSLPIEFEPDSHVNKVLLPTVHKLLDRQPGIGFEQPRYHQNLTGFVRGNWRAVPWSLEDLVLDEVYNTTEIIKQVVQSKDLEFADNSTSVIIRRQLDEGGLGNTTTLSSNMTSPATEYESINITTTSNRTADRGDYPWSLGGKVSFNLREERSSVTGAGDNLMKLVDGELVALKEGQRENWEEEGPVSYLHGDVTLSSIDGSRDFVLDIEAVHMLADGTFYGVATPPYVVSHLLDVPGLPLLHPNASNRSSLAAGHAVLKELDQRLERDRTEIEREVTRARDPFAPTGGAPCVFILYGSISTLPVHYSPALYAEYYSALFQPTGSSLRPPPAAVVDYLLYSENCALVLEGEAVALISPKMWERGTIFAGLLGLIHAIIAVLLVRQMEWGSSPSSCAKVAYSTIGMQAAMDAYSFIVCFTIGVVTNNRASLPLLVPAFFALVSSVLFGYRYATSIRSATPPPPRAPSPPRPPPLPTPEERAAAAAERRANGEEPLPPPEVVIPPFFEVPASSELKFLGYGIGIAFSATTVVVIWGWIALFTGFLFSYWIPQIIQNVTRGAARQSLRREYIIGITLGRLALPLYVWGCPNNLLSMDTSRWVFILATYSITQATILILQDSRLGARFFLNTFLLEFLSISEEETWDYHPLASSLDIENNANVDLHLEEDCPICFEKIIEPLTKEEKELDMGEREKQMRWEYMVPPCHHVAHTKCLESWLAIKQVCPVCRRRLPSL